MTADGGEAHGRASKQVVKPGDPRPYHLSCHEQVSQAFAQSFAGHGCDCVALTEVTWKEWLEHNIFKA